MSARDTVDLTGMLEWRCLGPHRGGRVVAVAGHPTDPMTFYFGACAGGVWKMDLPVASSTETTMVPAASAPPLYASSR